jgi:hypothetical protein
MGHSSWSDDAYQHLSSSYTSKSTDDIFTSNKKGVMSSDMSPKDVAFRESRDSIAHPNTVAIGLFLDETGSMGKIPEILVREKLGSLMSTLLTHGLPDAQVLFGGIGDHISDKCPLQVGQFESGTDELNKWLTSVYLEGNGGGQSMESYHLAWLFAARHTSIDCFEKRNMKGVLFTIGDEGVHSDISSSRLNEIMGYTQSESITAKELLQEAQRTYHVFHIHINHAVGSTNDKIIQLWRNLIGERLIILNDYNQISELVASTVAVIHGADIDTITSSFDSRIASNIKSALTKVDLSVANRNVKADVIKL